jgi:hypothetical protein
MNTNHELIQSLTGDNGELILRFFVTFSRFEYALKRAGFVRGDRNDALPDWSTFAKEKGNALFDGPQDNEFIDARAFLFREPPKKQIKRVTASGTSLGWQVNTHGSGESDAEYLLRLVRAVRNNLFHGGKYPDAPVNGQRLRNSRLLQACLVILERCLALDARVKQFFEEVYEE